MRGTNLAAAVGVMLLLAACEKEIPAGGGTGEKVTILFSINTSNYNIEDKVLRSADAGEAVTATIPLSDGLYLRATLTPDPEEELRLPTPFLDGQKIRFIAFNATTEAEVDSKVYTWSTSAGKFIPDADPLGVVPDDGTIFRFVAYSYFGETGVTPVASNINPVHDLVWGKTATDQTVTNTETSRTVSINMTHKFARVKVQVRSTEISGATIETLTGVEIMGGKQATLTPFSGNVAMGGTVTQGINISSSPQVDDISSSYRTVTPVSPAPAKVKFGGVKVSTNSTVFANKVAEFYSRLNLATSYLLVVDLIQGLAFAYSNIYWNGTKLTFDKTSVAASDADSRYYQGLYFKWGSLIGISPVWDGDNTLVYIPNNIAGRTWHDAEAVSSTSFLTALDIPYTTINTSITQSSTSSGEIMAENFLYDHPDFSQYLGDICNFIDDDWRMANAREIHTWFPGAGAYSVNQGSSYVVNSAGTGKMSKHKAFTSNGLLLPSSGFLSVIVNPPGAVGVNTTDGWYWLGSTGGLTNTANGYRINYRNLTTSVDNSSNRQECFPIRCVKR
jgi:hypothetical protein